MFVLKLHVIGTHHVSNVLAGSIMCFVLSGNPISACVCMQLRLCVYMCVLCVCESVCVFVCVCVCV